MKTEGSTHHQFVIDDDGDELLESVFEEVVPVLTSDGKPTKKHQMRLAIKARVEPHINMGLSCQRLQCLSWASSTAVLLSLALFLLSYSLDSTFFLPSLRIGFILAFIAQVFSVLALRTAHRLYITPLLWEQDRSPTDEVAMNMPQRFVKAEKGNHAKGLARYKSTLAWRKENDIETILTRPHLKFNLIKKYYPHAYHKRDKYGHPVYFEQPGRINLPILAENDITVSDLLYHCIFSSEYLWKMIEPDEENGKVFSVLDIEGIGLKDVGGAVTDFIKGASSVTGAHYPERSFKIFIINAPSWFSFAWRIISPMIDKTTRSKISILSADYQEALLEHIDADNLPVEYGGTCSCSRHDCSNGSVTEGVSGMSLPPPPSDEFRRAGEDGFIPVPCFLYSPEERDLKELAERANNKAE